MKKYCVFVLLVLPLLLNAVSIRDFLRNSGPSAGQRGTGYRLHESIEYQESFSEWIPATKYTMYYGGDTSAHCISITTITQNGQKTPFSPVSAITIMVS